MNGIQFFGIILGVIIIIIGLFFPEIWGNISDIVLKIISSLLFGLINLLRFIIGKQ